MTDQPGDLFGAALNERLKRQAPLAARLRPRTLDEMVGQEHLLGPDAPLRRLIEADRLTSVILWGPPGTGKTTLARLIAGVTASSFETLSAVNAGVKDVREVVARAKARLGEQGQGTILFLDEVHRFNKSQQDALLPHVEDGLLTLIGATTENPYFEVNAPLLSRSSLFRLDGLSPDAVRALLHRGLEAEEATADDEALDHLVNRSDGDARTALNALEVAVALAGDGRHVTLAERRGRPRRPGSALRARRPLRRGLGLHQVDPGIGPRRRPLLAGPHAGGGGGRPLHRPPAGDPGLGGRGHGRSRWPWWWPTPRPGRWSSWACPRPSSTWPRPWSTWPPPPSRTGSMQALGAAMDDVKNRPAGRCRPTCADAAYFGARKLGHGVGYDYPHDDPRGWVPQTYRPPEVEGRVYYQPSSHGFEEEVAERMRHTDAEPGDQ